MPWISMKADFTFFTLKMIVRHTFRESFVMSFLFGLCPLRAFAGMQVSLETINVDEVCILDVRMPNGPFILSTGTTSKSVASTIPTWGVSNFFFLHFSFPNSGRAKVSKKKTQTSSYPRRKHGSDIRRQCCTFGLDCLWAGTAGIIFTAGRPKKKVRSRSPSSRTIRRQCLL